MYILLVLLIVCLILYLKCMRKNEPFSTTGTPVTEPKYGLRGELLKVRPICDHAKGYYKNCYSL